MFKKNNCNSKFVWIAAIGVVFSPIVYSQSGGQFTITTSVIAGGGGRAEGGTFTTEVTLGQPVAGENSGGAFRLNTGFWAGGQSGDVARTSIHNVSIAQRLDLRRRTHAVRDNPAR